MGIKAGGVLGQHDPTPDGTVDVSPLLQSYDTNGQRLHTDQISHIKILGGNTGYTTTNLYDVTGNTGLLGDGSAITPVAVFGNERWITILAYYDRFSSGQSIDGHGDIVQTRTTDSFKFRILQGTEGTIGSAVRPSLPGDGSLCIGDISIRNLMTTITDTYISYTRKSLFVPAIATQLKIVTAPQNMPSNYPSNFAVVVYAEDGSGNLATNVTGTVSLSCTASTVQFSALASPFTPVTTITMIDGIASFYVKDTVVENITITASNAGGLPAGITIPALQNEIVLLGVSNTLIFNYEHHA